MGSNRRESGSLNRLWEDKYSRQRSKQAYTTEDLRDDPLDFPEGVSLFECLNKGDKVKLIETLFEFQKDQLDPPGNFCFPALRKYLSSVNLTSHRGVVSCNGPSPKCIILDERRDPIDTSTTTRQWDSVSYLDYPPTGGNVKTEELDLTGLIRRLSEKRLENGAERRTLFICDLTPSCAMAILATTPARSILALRNFFHNRLLSRPLFRAKMSVLTYVLEFHIPYFVLREGAAIPDQRIPKAERSRERNLLPLAVRGEKVAYFYEAQISFILTGIDERLYTAICTVDTFFGGENHHKYLNANIPRDALAGGFPELQYPVWNPRQYWLVVQSHRISQAVREWTDLVNCFVARLNHYEQNFELPDDVKLTKTTELTKAERTIRLFRDKLNNTVQAWEAFQSNKGSIYEVESTILYEHWQGYLGSIRESISDLKGLCGLMSQKLELFQSMREGLVNASSLKSSTEAVGQGTMVGILTMVTVLFLPSAFVTALFSMLQLKNSPGRWISYCVSVVLATTGTLYVARRPQLLRSLFSHEYDKQYPPWYQYSRNRRHSS